MSLFKRIFGNVKSIRRRCDICNKKADLNQGYILSTKQVVYKSGYWKKAFQLMPLSEKKLEGFLPKFIRKMTSSESDWIVCAECISVLNVDKTLPSKYFSDYIKTGQKPSITDSGPADASRAAIIASSAFESVFGRNPTSIKIMGEESQTIDSEEFSRKFSALYKSGDKKGLGELAGHKIRCNECGSVMPGIETQVTKKGMNCPRCGKPWFLMMKR